MGQTVSRPSCLFNGSPCTLKCCSLLKRFQTGAYKIGWKNCVSPDFAFISSSCIGDKMAAEYSRGWIDKSRWHYDMKSYSGLEVTDPSTITMGQQWGLKFSLLAVSNSVLTNRRLPVIWDAMTPLWRHCNIVMLLLTMICRPSGHNWQY